MAAICPLSRSRRGLLVKSGSNGIFPAIMPDDINKSARRARWTRKGGKRLFPWEKRTAQSNRRCKMLNQHKLLRDSDDNRRHETQDQARVTKG